MVWGGWGGASVTGLAGNEPLHLGVRAYVIDLAVLAWAYAIGSRWMPRRGLRTFLRTGAALQAALPVFVSAGPDWLMAAAPLATRAAGARLWTEGPPPAWWFPTPALFPRGWVRPAQSLLSPPPAATP